MDKPLSMHTKSVDRWLHGADLDENVRNRRRVVLEEFWILFVREDLDIGEDNPFQKTKAGFSLIPW